MIKKQTKAIFEDGEYAGMYDWEGGIPLSEGEKIVVKVNKMSLDYTLASKHVVVQTLGPNQTVKIEYRFRLST